MWRAPACNFVLLRNAPFRSSLNISLLMTLSSFSNGFPRRLGFRRLPSSKTKLFHYCMPRLMSSNDHTSSGSKWILSLIPLLGPVSLSFCKSTDVIVTHSPPPVCDTWHSAPLHRRYSSHKGHRPVRGSCSSGTHSGFPP